MIASGPEMVTLLATFLDTDAFMTSGNGQTTSGLSHIGTKADGCSTGFYGIGTKADGCSTGFYGIIIGDFEDS